jgi:hypothetical protein
MIRMPDTKAKYFSVKNSTTIQGMHYTPSVCYPLSQGLQAVIEEMAAKDMARIYPEKVRFVTGVPYPVKKPETGAAVSRSSSVPVSKAKTDSTVKLSAQKLSSAAGKLSRKSGRSAYTSQTDREFD